jgi:hypothetical protein
VKPKNQALKNYSCGRDPPSNFFPVLMVVPLFIPFR